MKKLLAMLLVLMLALSCTAFAEPSTAYTIALMNPVITYMDQSIDMTGLDVELSAIVSDVGQFAVNAQANVGPNFENSALDAQAQLDSNGLTFTADGMSNVYGLDLTQFTNGFDVTSLLPMIPAYSMLKEPIVMESAEIDLSLSARYAAVSELFAPYTNNGAIAIDRTQGELLVNQLLTSLETASAAADIDGIAELRQMRPAFDLNGSLTAAGDGSYTLTGTGNLYSAESTDTIAYDINVADSDGSTNAVINLYEPAATEVITIALDSFSNPVDNDRSAVQTVVTLSMSDSADSSAYEEFMNVTFTATPVEGSRQVDYVAAVNVPSEETDMTLAVSTGTNGDDIGFAIDLFMNIDGSSDNLFLYYTGAKAVDSLGTAINGQVKLGGNIEGEYMCFDTGLLLRNTAMDTTEWVYDSTGAIDVENMDEMQSNTAMIGLLGIAGNAMTLIDQHVPGLAPLLQAAVSDMM